MLGGGRRWESLALPHWAPVYPVACCTLEGLRRGACAQPGKWMPDQGGERDLPVPWGCVSRSRASGPHGMASWPLPMGVARQRAGEGGQGLPSAVFLGVQRGWDPPWGWDWAGVWVAGGCLARLPAPRGTGGLHRILPVPAVPLHSPSAPPAPMSYDCPCGASDVPCRALLDAEAAAWAPQGAGWDPWAKLLVLSRT